MTINTTTSFTLQDFCELTRRGCSLKFLPVDHIINKPDGWTKLASTWELLIDEADVDIFRDAAYFIKWGIPATSPYPEYHKLVEAVSNALLHDGPAYDAWINHNHCLSVIFETAHEFNPWCTNGAPYSFSNWHHRYTASKMLLRILRYRKGHITKCKAFDSDIRYYEGRILKLVPSAKDWPFEYWLNENNIINELNKVSPYDYRNDLPSYNALLNLTNSPKRMPNSHDYSIIIYACNVKAFSEEWIAQLWPKKSKAIIVQYFLLAEEMAQAALESPWLSRPIGYYDPIPGIDYNVISHSWITSHVSNMLYNNSLPAGTEQQVKLALFNVAAKC